MSTPILGRRTAIAVIGELATAQARVSPKESAIAAAEPGERVTWALEVAWDGPQTVEVTERLALPPGWHSVVPAGSFTVQERGSAMRLISVQVPRSAPPAAYPIHYEVLPPSVHEDGPRPSKVVLVVSVSAQPDLSVSLMSRGGFIMAGEPHVARFQVINSGNVQLITQLAGESGANATATPRHTGSRPGPCRG